MSTQDTPPLDPRDGLREALKAHDSAAITHMKAASKHLRESRQIADRIERLSDEKATGQ